MKLHEYKRNNRTDQYISILTQARTRDTGYKLTERNWQLGNSNRLCHTVTSTDIYFRLQAPRFYCSANKKNT